MGQKNIPLNARGIEQAYAAAEILSKESITTICCSSLDRAKETAKIVAEKIKARLVEIPDLMECGWGEREGEIKGKWTEDWRNGNKITGAELYSSFIQRARDGLNKAIIQDDKVLVVAHGGIFWAVQHFGNLGSRFDLKNATPVYLRAPIKSDLPWSISEL